MKGGFLLNVIIRERAAVFELLASEDQPLLVRRDALLILDLGLHVVDGVAGLHIKGDGLASQRLHKDLHATSQAQHQVKGGFLLNVIIRERAAVFELLASEDQPLLVRRDALLILDLGLHVVDGVAGLHIKGDGLASQRLHKDLHATSQAQHQVKGGFLLNVIIRERAAVFELLASEDQPLLVRRDALLILDLGLHVVDGVAGLHIKGDGLASQCLHKDLHATSQAQHQVKGGFLLNVIIRERAAVFELLASEDQPLLVRRDALLILDLGLHVVDGVAGLHIKGDGLASQCLHKDLHATSQAQHQVKGGFLLNVIIRERAAVFELLASEDQPLLVRRDALLILDLGLHVVDGVAGLHIKGDGLASQRLHKDLHATSQAQHQVKGGFLLNVIIRERAAVFELLASEDQPLLVRRDALLILDLGLHVVDGVAGLHIKGDGLASQCLHKDLHATSQAQHQVKGGFLLNVIIRERAAVFELLASEDQPLLVRRDALLILDLGLHVVDGVAGLHIKGDGLASQRLHKDLHATSQAQHQVKGGFLLNVIIRERAAVFELLASEDQPLLVRRDALLILDLGLHVVDGVAGLHIKGDGLASQRLHKDLHATSQAQHQVKGGFLLNVIVRERAAVFELLASEDQPLLVRRDALLILDLGLHVVDGVAGLHIKGDGLASQRLHKDLHTTSQAQHQVKGGFLLNVIIRERAAVFELLASEDQPLLVRRDALLILDLGLHVVNGVAGLHIKSDGLASQCLHKDLHATSQAQHQVKGGFLLNVIIRERAAVFELLASEDQPLLVRRDALLILDLGLHVVDGVAGLHIKGDGLASQRLHKDLHATSQAQHQVKGGFLLNVIIRERAAVFELLASEDQPLLVRRDALLILDLGLHVVDGVAGLHIKGDGLASQRLHKDLHATSQAQHQVKGGFLLNVIVRERAAVFELLASEDQTLLVRRDALLILDLGLHVVDGVAGLHIKGDGLASQRLHKDLHDSCPDA